jgi:hypothetical protein
MHAVFLLAAGAVIGVAAAQYGVVAAAGRLMSVEPILWY